MSRQDIIEHRKNKFLNIGRNKNLSNNVLSSEDLFSDRISNILDVRNKIGRKKTYTFLLIFLAGIFSLIVFQLLLR